MDDEKLKERLKDIADRRLRKFKAGSIVSETEYASYEGLHVGCNLTKEEIEFGRAMYKERERLLHYPSFIDVLRVVKELGYVKEPCNEAETHS